MTAKTADGTGIVGLLLAAARGGAPGRWLGGRKGFGFDGTRMMSGGLGCDRRVQRSSLMQAFRGVAGRSLPGEAWEVFDMGG